MDILKMGAEMLMSKIGGEQAGGLGIDKVTSMLSGVLGDANGNLNLQSLIDSLKEKGLGSIADSWLGDGENAPIAPEQVEEVVGADRISQLAAQFGTDKGSILSGLADALPQVVDKSSSGGSLLDSIGGLDGVMGMAKKFLR